MILWYMFGRFNLLLLSVWHCIRTAGPEIIPAQTYDYASLNAFALSVSGQREPPLEDSRTVQRVPSPSDPESSHSHGSQSDEQVGVAPGNADWWIWINIVNVQFNGFVEQ